MATPGESVFRRALSEAGLGRLLLTAVSGWLGSAVVVALREDTSAALRDELESTFREQVLEQVLSAATGGQSNVMQTIIENWDLVADVTDVLSVVRDYAALNETSRAATEALMRKAVAIDRGLVTLVPEVLTTPSALLVPARPGPGPVTVPHHPKLLAPNVPLADYGHTYQSRTEAVARTLATAAYGWQVRADAERTGDELRWVTVKDDRVRQAHRHAQGQTVAHDEPFMVGGFPMWFPGDPNAPEELTINCRCVLATVPAPDRRYVQRYIPRDWLNAAAMREEVSVSTILSAGGPDQARAPRGTPIGGEWIETPAGLMQRLLYGVDPSAPPPEMQTYYVPDADAPDDEFENIAAVNTMKDATEFSPEGIETLRRYSGTEANRTNNNLRRVGGDISGWSEVERHRIGHIDEMIAMSPASADILTKRLVSERVFANMPEYKDLDSLVGQVITDQAFLSTSIGGTYGDLERSGIEFRITVPKGSPALWVKPISDWPGENELLLPRGTPLAITGVQQGGRTYIDAVVATPEVLASLLAAGWRTAAWNLYDLIGPLTAGGGPEQARAPKGTPIGGQWIDTPNAILRSLSRLEVGKDEGAEMGDLDAMRAERRELAADVLEAEGRPSLEDTAARVGEIYDLTSPEQREAGAHWYDEAHGLAEQISTESGGTISVEQAAAIIAHTSTRTSWPANVIIAQGVARGDDIATINAALKAAGQGGAMKDNITRAQKVLAGGDPFATFGPGANKTKTFATNIAGERDGVTVDVHMYRVLGQSDVINGKVPGNPLWAREDKVYEALAESVRVAAEKRGVTPREMQATTWVWMEQNFRPERRNTPARILEDEGNEFPIYLTAAAEVVEEVVTEPAFDIIESETPDYFYAQRDRLLGVDALTAAFNPAQARIPKGSPSGGEWTPTALGVMQALQDIERYGWQTHPFKMTSGAADPRAVAREHGGIANAESSQATSRMTEDTINGQVNGYLRDGGTADDAMGESGLIIRENGEPISGQSWFQDPADQAALYDYEHAALPESALPDMVQAVDAAMARGTFVEPVTLYRGIASEEDAKWTPGDRWLERGYSSVSDSPGIATNFATLRAGQPSAFRTEVGLRADEQGGRPTLLRINVAPNTRFIPGAIAVREVMLERSMIYQVVSSGTELVSYALPNGNSELREFHVVNVYGYPASSLREPPTLTASMEEPGVEERLWGEFAPEFVGVAPLTQIRAALEGIEDVEFLSPEYMAMAQNALDVANEVRNSGSSAREDEGIAFAILALSRFLSVDWPDATEVKGGLTGAGDPGQARAPKGTPIGGEWIDTPLTILDKIMMESRGEKVPEDPKYRNAQAIADEYKTRLEEAIGDPNLEVTVNGTSGGDEYGTKLMGVITDKSTGEWAGDFERTMFADGHVYHDQFRLAEQYQGKGIGSRMLGTSEDFYRELGYDRIELNAGLDVGGYTWARQGFEFEGQLTAYDVAYYAWDSITSGRVAGVSAEAKNQAISIFQRAQAESAASGDADTSFIPSGILPAEIAAIGWTPGAEMWPGKEVLLGYEWHGVKHLYPPEEAALAAAATTPVDIAIIHRAWVPTADYDRTRPVEVPETQEDAWTTPESDEAYWTQVLPLLESTVTAAGGPDQARAPKGTEIGGQWIDTPTGLMDDLEGADRRAAKRWDGKGEPLDFATANEDPTHLQERVNPGYGLGPEFGQNCTRVAFAAEMQARGYPNAVAPPFHNDYPTFQPDMERKWQAPPEGGPYRYFRNVEGGDFAGATAGDPVGSRYWVNGMLKKRGGHVWNAVKTADGFVQIDAQSGKDPLEFLDQMGITSILRVDDLEPTFAAVKGSNDTGEPAWATSRQDLATSLGVNG